MERLQFRVLKSYTVRGGIAKHSGIEEQVCAEGGVPATQGHLRAYTANPQCQASLPRLSPDDRIRTLEHIFTHFPVFTHFTEPSVFYCKKSENECATVKNTYLYNWLKNLMHRVRLRRGAESFFLREKSSRRSRSQLFEVCLLFRWLSYGKTALQGYLAHKKPPTPPSTTIEA